MRQNTKRFLFLLLCLVILGTFIPASAAQRETDPLPESSETAANAAKPTIKTQPKNVTKNVGEVGKFTVKASGATKYQWYWRRDSGSSWVKSTASSAATATLSLKAIMARTGCQYRCKVSNSSGSVYTKTVTFTVIGKPEIATQPKSLTKDVGTTAKFTVKAYGATAYQWYWRRDSSSSWVKSTASSATSATLSLKAIMARTGCQYRCKVTNSTGSVYTKTVTLTVNGKPEIATQPKSITKDMNSTGKFTVKAYGATSYQWYWRKNSNSNWVKSTASSAQSPTLSLKAIPARDGAQYRCKVTNSKGSVYSKIATFTVNCLPVILEQPSGLTISEGGTAAFTVKAKNVEAYQWYWWEESQSRWLACAGDSATTNTLQYTDILHSWDGFIFSCKLTNSYGVQWTLGVGLTVTGRHVPVIKTQPKSVSVGEGETAYFDIETRYEDSFQWYWRKNSSSGWNEIPESNTNAIAVNDVTYAKNGYQYRCKVINSEHSVYSNTVTLTVNPVTYRALLVAEVNFYSMDAAPRFQGSVDLVANMLQSAKGPMGRAYTVTSVTDVGLAGLEDAIDNTFAGADDNDVSLFYIVTHGATDYASGTHAGELVLAGPYGDVRITLERLADDLLAVPGKVIVFLDSCGSGAAVWEGNGAPSSEQAAAEAAAFNEAAIAAFAEAEASLASPNTGEFIDPKFYVITAAAHQEMSWGTSALNYTYFGWYLALGPLGRKPADEEGDGNGTVTLNELYNYVYTHALGPYTSDGVDYYQHAQVYPENSSYELFK